VRAKVQCANALVRLTGSSRHQKIKKEAESQLALRERSASHRREMHEERRKLPTQHPFTRHPQVAERHTTTSTLSAVSVLIEEAIRNHNEALLDYAFDLGFDIDEARRAVEKARWVHFCSARQRRLVARQHAVAVRAQRKHRRRYNDRAWRRQQRRWEGNPSIARRFRFSLGSDYPAANLRRCRCWQCRLIDVKTGKLR